MKIKQLGFVSGVALATLVTASAAQAALVVVPPGLNPGDQYRLVFVTSGTRNATSSNINDYNTFVTNQVTGSALATQLTTAGFNLGTITWKAIGSTSATSAKVNTGTDGSQPDVPIYLINGNKVANNNADLWDGSILTTIELTPAETAPPNFRVFSGTNSDGTSAGAANALGGSDSFAINVGRNDYFNSSWIFAATRRNDDPLPFYGMSSVLTVPTPAVTVPEPSSPLGLITLGGLMLGSAVRLTGGGSDT
ncbi:MAG: PEP-CTERM sorting domain-containing protein [Microcystis aeruginosa]